MRVGVDAHEDLRLTAPVGRPPATGGERIVALLSCRLAGVHARAAGLRHGRPFPAGIATLDNLESTLAPESGAALVAGGCHEPDRPRARRFDCWSVVHHSVCVVIVRPVALPVALLL